MRRYRSVVIDAALGFPIFGPSFEHPWEAEWYVVENFLFGQPGVYGVVQMFDNAKFVSAYQVERP